MCRAGERGTVAENRSWNAQAAFSTLSRRVRGLPSIPFLFKIALSEAAREIDRSEQAFSSSFRSSRPLFATELPKGGANLPPRGQGCHDIDGCTLDSRHKKARQFLAKRRHFVPVINEPLKKQPAPVGPHPDFASFLQQPSVSNRTQIVR
jgi:hypothetical protein